MSDQFQEGTTPDAYDFRGNRNPESLSWEEEVPAAPVSVPNPAPVQTSVPVSETGGYKAPGGGTRDAIRARMQAVRPYTFKDVYVDEWESEFQLRSMTLGDRNDMMEVMLADGTGKADVRKMFAAIIIASTFDSEGEKVFTEEDEGWLNSLPASIVDKLAKPAMDLSGLGDEKRVDEEAKKSSKTEDAE